MEKFKYRGEFVEVDYQSIDDDPEYNPEIIINHVYYCDVDILPIMNQSDELELKEEMYDKLFN
jgi:hypothetical protein